MMAKSVAFSTATAKEKSGGVKTDRATETGRTKTEQITTPTQQRET
jgi:hypothetical protein